MGGVNFPFFQQEGGGHSAALQASTLGHGSFTIDLCSGTGHEQQGETLLGTQDLFKVAQSRETVRNQRQNDRVTRLQEKGNTHGEANPCFKYAVMDPKQILSLRRKISMIEQTVPWGYQLTAQWQKRTFTHRSIQSARDYLKRN